MIYFIQRGDAGPIKIGYAKDLGTRLQNLQTWHDEPLRVVGVIEGDRTTERQMHERFASLRIRGEWFECREELSAFVATLITPDVPEAKRAASVTRREIRTADRARFLPLQVQALAKRTSLLSPMGRSTLAQELNVHPDTVLNWMHGKTVMSGADICAVAEYFGTRGDFGFIADIHAPALARRIEGAAQLEQQAQRIRANVALLSESEEAA